MGRAACVLGVDPGLASFGYTSMYVTASMEWVKDVGVIRTKKSDKKQKVLASDDNFRRAQEVAKQFSEYVRKLKPAAVAAEAMSFPRNASTAAKMAMAWGVLAEVCRVYDLPMVQATPQQIKKCLCDNKSAKKEAVQESLMDRYPGQFSTFMDLYPSGAWEHGFDAVGAVVTCLDSDVVRMARRLAEQG